MGAVFLFGTAGMILNLTLGMVTYLLGLHEEFTSYMLSLMAVTVLSMPILAWLCSCGSLKRCIRKYDKKLGSFDNALLVLTGFSGCMVINLVMVILTALFPFMGSGETALSDRTDMYGISMLLLAVAVCPAVCEEVAFRGFVMGRLKEYGDGFAVVMSALVFGMMHGNLPKILFAFLTGLLLGCIRQATGSLIPSMLVHFCNNAVSVLFGAFYNVNFILLFHAGMILLLLLSGMMVYRRKLELLRLSVSGTAIKTTFQQPLFWTFVSEVVIIGWMTNIS